MNTKKHIARGLALILLCAAMLLQLPACKGAPNPDGKKSQSSKGSSESLPGDTESLPEDAESGGDGSVGGSVANSSRADGSKASGSSSTGTGSGGKKVELYVDLHGWMPTLNKEATAENPTVFISSQIVADAFTAKYPNITIKWARTKPVGSDEEALAQWFTTQIASGLVPAIAFSWGTQFQERGWYLDLDEYLNQSNPYIKGNKKWRDAFPDYLWSLPSISSAQKKVVAIPIALYPGPATSYYYNKSAFAKAGINGTPKTWEQLVSAAQKLKGNGYASAPWGGTKGISANSWIAQFCLGPSVAGYIMNKIDYDGNGVLDTVEQLRATKAGLFNPVSHDYAKEYYKQQKRYYSQILAAGWQNTQYGALWNSNQVGMKEGGIWELHLEESNKLRGFDFGVFPTPMMGKDTSPYSVETVYTQKGPWQPDPDLQLNIMKNAVNGKPEVLDAAVKFLQFLTTPENNGMMIQEQGAAIGAVLGAPAPAVLKDYLNQPFPKTPKASWPIAFTAEQDQNLHREMENWVNNKTTDAVFFAKVNELQQKGADDMIKSMGINTKGW